MRISLLALIISLFAITAHAQEKGQLLLGGGLLYNSTFEGDSLTETSQYNLAAGPFAGLMVTQRIAVGFQSVFRLDYEKTIDKENDFSTTRNIQAMTVGVFGRYHGNFTDKLLYIGQVNFSKDFRLNGNTPHPQIYRLNATAGLLYFVAERVSLGINVASLNFMSETQSNIDYKRRDFNLDYNILNPQLEVVFYL